MEIDFHKIGRLINEIRLNRGISQNQFAEDIGVSKAAVTQWEKGTNGIKTEKLYDIAQYFGITMTELISGKREKELLRDYLNRNYDLYPFRNLRAVSKDNINEVYQYLALCKSVITRFNEIYPKWLSNELSNEEKEEFDYLKVNYIDPDFEKVKVVMTFNRSYIDYYDWTPIQDHLRQFKDKSEEEQSFEKWKVLRFQCFITPEAIIKSSLETRKDKLFKNYLTILTSFDKNILLSKLIDEKTPKDIQDSTLIKELIEDGAECLFSSNEFEQIHYSKEDMDYFEGPFIRNEDKSKVADLFEVFYSYDRIKSLPYSRYQNLINNKKTEEIKNIINLRKTHPNEYVNYLRQTADSMLKA